jgi:hypothetical protein
MRVQPPAYEGKKDVQRVARARDGDTGGEAIAGEPCADG